jgi:hypothetical protein
VIGYHTVHLGKNSTYNTIETNPHIDNQKVHQSEGAPRGDFRFRYHIFRVKVGQSREKKQIITAPHRVTRINKRRNRKVLVKTYSCNTKITAPSRRNNKRFRAVLVEAIGDALTASRSLLKIEI